VRFALCLTALTLSLAAAPAIAQTAPAAPADAGAAAAAASGDSITIGAGGAYIPDYEGSDHYVLRAVPGAIGSIHGFNFTLAANRATIDLIPNPPGPSWDIQAGPIGVVDFNRSSLKSIDDPRVRALGKRGTALEVGGFVGIGKTGVITSDYDRLSISISYRKGVTGAHRAGILSPMINYFTPLSTKAAVGVYVSAERAERGYARAYYDVDAAQGVASGLPAYSTRGGWKNWTVGALGTVAITGDLLHGFKLVGGGTYSRMLGDFARSPIVSVAGDRGQWQAVLGLAYTF
jgi:outer membrane scaffolding protein for murein synthesis (MipA/OmpV family)